MVRKLVAIVAAVALVVGCAPRQPEKPPLTQLEVREFQTRTFDTRDGKMVLKALFNVLQDEGFVVKQANVDLGLISASKETDLQPNQTASAERTSPSPGQWVVGALALAALLGIIAASATSNADVGYGSGGYGGSSTHPRVRKTEVVDCTGNVSEFGQQTKVRVSFQRKILDEDGDTIEVQQIEDLNYYQDFFVKVDKGLFLQKEQL